VEIHTLKFGTYVDCIKSEGTDDNYPWEGRGQGHVTRYKFGSPNRIFVMSENRQYKFRVQIDTVWYYTPEGVYSGTPDFCIFWK